MKLRRTLGSVKLAAALIAALLGLSLLSVIVPQTPTLGGATVQTWREAQPWLAEPAIALGLDRVFVSWPYWIVSALLALNLIVCTYDRTRRTRSTPASVGVPPDDAVRVGVAPDPEAAAARLTRGLPFYRVDEVDGGLACRSGRIGFAGSVLMHVGLVLVIIAGVVTGLTRFEGELVLTEGIGASDVEAAYTKVVQLPMWGDPYTGSELLLDKMEFEYEELTVTDVRALVSVGGGEAASAHVVRVNEPLRVGTKTFLLKDSGYAVGLRVTDASGTVLPDSLVNLATSRPDGYADTVEIGELRLGLLAVPDGKAPRGVPVTRKLVPVDPAIVVTATVDGRQVLRDEIVRPGQVAKAGAWGIELIELRRWTRFNARVDAGVYIVYVALLLVVFGSAARLLDPDRTVRVRYEDGAAFVWARARWGSGVAASATAKVARLLEEEPGQDEGA